LEIFAGFTWLQLAVALGTGLTAAFIRGLAGFGLAILLVPVLALTLTPVEAVLTTNVVALLIGGLELPRLLREAERSVWTIILLVLLTTLPGLALLAATPPNIARLLIALVALFALAGHSESPLSLILAGIAISTLAGAGISLALNLSPNPFAGMEITTWLLGSIENRSIDHVWIALPCIAIGIALLLVDGRALDALSLGEDGAQALGVDLKRTRLRLLLGVGIGVGGAVAVSGAIGFIGLIVPHLVRPLTDRSPSALLLPSLLAGAALLTLADVAVRLIPTQSELKLGVVTAFLGVPVFLVHLLRERRLW